MSNQLIRILRDRKKYIWRQIMLNGNYAGSTYYRIEQGHQKPKPPMVNDIMRVLHTPMDNFFSPYFDNQKTDAYLWRDRLIRCLDEIYEQPSLCAEVKQMIDTLSRSEGFDKGINRQFILYCQAQLLDGQGAEAADILPLIKEGLNITFPEFDESNLSDIMCIHYEAGLLHVLALVYSRTGKVKEAIRLLYASQEGLATLPEDNLEKEKRLPRSLLTLSHLLIQEKQYEEAMTVIEHGCWVSWNRLQGGHLPDFFYAKALCWLGTGRTAECRLLLPMVYFGYLLLHKKDLAEQVKNAARDLFNVDINTYGANQLILDTPYHTFPVPQRVALHCTSVGQLIGVLRSQAGISEETLCSGTCSKSTLNKIENGRIKDPSYHYLEVFMQRLGRDINLYFDTLLSAQEFEDKQLRDKINTHLVAGEYDEASQWLLKLEVRKDFRKGVNLQFIKCAKITTCYGKRDIDRVKIIALLLEALNITMPNFDERKIASYYLSYYEIVLINQIAMNYCENNESVRGLKIFERLKESMDSQFVDESEKTKTYTMVLYNFTKYLGLQKHYQQALSLIDEGEEMAIRNRRITPLPGFAINKACDLYETGKKEESVPYFALAYWGYGMIGVKKTQQLIYEYVREHLGMELIN